MRNLPCPKASCGHLQTRFRMNQHPLKTIELACSRLMAAEALENCNRSRTPALPEAILTARAPSPNIARPLLRNAWSLVGRLSFRIVETSVRVTEKHLSLDMKEPCPRATTWLGTAPILELGASYMRRTPVRPRRDLRGRLGCRQLSINRNSFFA